MRTVNSEDAMEIAFDSWLRTALHARYDAVAAAPVPLELLRLVQGEADASRAASAVVFRPQSANDSDPAFGLAMAGGISGLFWVGLALALRAF
ncbi:MAG: hypothetical protein ICV73_30890 [Acetobacteraceae bacterium]|nr:hypothetical protein [Acetobacteraceae bacterium]